MADQTALDKASLAYAVANGWAVGRRRDGSFRVLSKDAGPRGKSRAVIHLGRDGVHWKWRLQRRAVNLLTRAVSFREYRSGYCSTAFEAMQTVDQTKFQSSSVTV